MALDVNILDTSLIQPKGKFDIGAVIDTYGAVQDIRNRQKLSELTLSKEEKAQKRAEEYQGILKSSLTPNGHVNSEKAIVDLNRAGFLEEAAAIQDRFEKAKAARFKADEEKEKEMSTVFGSVVDSTNPVEAFILAKEEGKEKGWKMSPGVLNYIPGDEEIRDGKLDPRVMQEMKYHGEKFLTPEQRIARAKVANDGTTADEYGLAPIYGTKNGKPVALQTSKKGGVKEIELPPGIELTPGVSYQNLGDKVVVFDKSGAPIARIAKGVDPGKAADLEIDRAKEARDAQEYAKKVRAYDTKAKGETASIQTFIDRAHKVKANDNMKYVTGIGKLGRLLPGSPAANLQADIDFLVSSGVIETLTQLKNQSPTGATGFGALSDSELTAIKNAFSTLGNTDIGPEKKRDEVKRILDKMESRLREHREISRESDKTLGPEPTESDVLDAGIQGL